MYHSNTFFKGSVYGKYTIKKLAKYFSMVNLKLTMAAHGLFKIYQWKQCALVALYPHNPIIRCLSQCLLNISSTYHLDLWYLVFELNI